MARVSMSFAGSDMMRLSKSEPLEQRLEGSARSPHSTSERVNGDPASVMEHKASTDDSWRRSMGSARDSPRRTPQDGHSCSFEIQCAIDPHLTSVLPPLENNTQSRFSKSSSSERHNTTNSPFQIPRKPLPTESQASKPTHQHVLSMSSAAAMPAQNSSIEKDGPSTEMNNPWKPGRQEYLVLITLTIVSFIVALDATIVAPSLSKLANDLNGSGIEAFWAGTSYLLTSAVFQPFIAALSDIFGRRAILTIAVGLFTLGAIVAGAAHSFAVLLVGRSIQGVGGGGIITLNLVIFTDVVPLRDRPKWFGMPQGAWALGTILGPLIGGVFVQESTWRWTYWINFPFCGIALVMVPLVVKLRMKESTFVSKLKRVDWVGGFLFIAGTTSFLIAITWGGVQYSWSSVHVVVPMILGILGAVLALLWDMYFAREPFFRHSLFYNISSIAAYFSAWVQGLVLFASLYYLTIYLQGVKDRTPVMAGLGLLPISIALLPGSVLTGLFVSRTGHFRWAVWLGWTVATITGGSLTLLDEKISTPKWAAILVFFGCAHGLLLTAVNFAIQSIAKEGDEAAAAAMYAFFRSFGMSIGVAVGGTAFQNEVKQVLSREGLPESIAKDAAAWISKLKAMPGTSDLKQDVEHAFAKGIQTVYIVLTCLCAAALCATLFMKHYSMDRLLVSEHKLQGKEGKDAQAHETV